MHAFSMLALGETGVLPGILILFILFPATIFALIFSIGGKRNILIFISGVASLLFGAYGVFDCLKTIITSRKISNSWLPNDDFNFAFLFCAIFLVAGFVLIYRFWRYK